MIVRGRTLSLRCRYSLPKNDEFCAENDEICTENDEFVPKNDEFGTENDGLSTKNDWLRDNAAAAEYLPRNDNGVTMRDFVLKTRILY